MDLNVSDRLVSSVVRRLFIGLCAHPRLVGSFSAVRTFLCTTVEGTFIGRRGREGGCLCLSRFRGFRLPCFIRGARVRSRRRLGTLGRGVREVVGDLAPQRGRVVCLQFLRRGRCRRVTRVVSVSRRTTHGLACETVRGVEGRGGSFFMLLFVVTLFSSCRFW